MSDLIDAPDSGQNAPEFTVSEISGVVKRLIEGEFSHVRIRGEVGRVSRPASGHLYLDLKDDRAVLAGVIWKGVAARLRHRPEEGMEVVATGRLTTFAGQSRYQMVIEDISPAGEGALMAMLERRKKALAAEGLFAADAKHSLPYLPEVIGVVTSPSGAVIRDILHRLRDRFPRKVLVWPVPVQGEKCAPSVAAAIAGFNRLQPGGALPRPDLLIVARGGGSIEDLWGFNEEIVVRAAAASSIPLISAVGHETDTTLIDLAADQRAPTPTAAAELAVPVRADLLAHLTKLEARRVRAQADALQRRAQRLRDLARALPRPVDLLAGQAQKLDNISLRLIGALQSLAQAKRIMLARATAGLRPKLLQQGVAQRRQNVDRLETQLVRGRARATEQCKVLLHGAVARLNAATPQRRIADQHSHLARLSVQFAQAMRSGVARQRAALDALERVRQTLGYTQTLKRGFAVVRSNTGQIVTHVAATRKSPTLEIQFQDGRIKVAKASGPAPRPKRPGGDAGDKGQGRLF